MASSRLLRSFPVWAALALAACADTGAHLTFSAPSGPMTVTSFQVVLATPEQVPSISGQRMQVDAVATQSVSYYLQRTVAGGTHGKIDSVDGFSIRVEPDPAMTETQFIPFVLMYDGDKIVAIATYYALPAQIPAPILVLRDEIDKYMLRVEPVVQLGDMDPVTAGSVRVVTCASGDRPFTSGIVWRSTTGGEMRLLFPDDGGLDATGRALDLDCDAHEVTTASSAKDCDDSRDWFNSDAAETCDGFDTNCDGLQNLVVACTGSNVCPDAATNAGVALCNDRTGEQSRCESDPQCLCAAGTACPHCVIMSENGTTLSTVRPCQPSIGYLLVDELCPDGAPCSRVEVVATNGGWKADISHDADPLSFALVQQNLAHKVVLRVRRAEGPGVEITGTRGTSTGDVMLAFTKADGTVSLYSLDLQLDLDGAPTGGCAGAGPYPMYCYQ